MTSISAAARDFIKAQGGIVTLGYEIEACGCGPARYFPMAQLGEPPRYAFDDYYREDEQAIVIYILKNMQWPSGILLDIDTQARNREETLIFRLTDQKGKEV